MPEEKRKKFWIDASLQTFMVGGMAVMMAAGLWIVYMSVDRGIEEAARSADSIFVSVDWVRHTIKGPFYLSSAIVIVASAMLALLGSHRVIGPLMVLTAGLRRIREGNLGAGLQVRDTDSIPETAHDFDKMQEALREQIIEDRKHLHRIDTRLEQLAAELRPNAKAEEEIESIRKELKKVASFFHLS